MRAAILRNGSMVVDDVADPVPGLGQILVRTLACGICGSDLHFAQHGQAVVDLTAQAGLVDEVVSGPVLDLSRDVIMGHEFSAEVLEVGPDTIGPEPGAVVVSMPVMLTDTGVSPTAYSNEYPGGFAERMLLSAPLVLEVPNGCSPRRAAMTEPTAVGLHAVAKSGIAAGQSALVVGCGPVGLAVISALKLAGVEVIVASDLSPRRRDLALLMGAGVVVDPVVEPAMDAWRRADGVLPLVIFEAVGIPGMLQSIMRDAPRSSLIVVVGVCMQPDSFQPFFGTAKELSLQFVLAYDPMEFARALRVIAEGAIDVDPLITGSVGIEGVPGAFEDLANPEAHAKIVVEP
ncbi:MAG: zinc-binding dehydrogenase [Acidimicrobiales bacterium]